MLLFTGTLMLAYVGVRWRHHDVAVSLAFAALGLMLVAFALAA
jgi:threonine/homoserine efflux transporter RhtA